MWNLNCLRNINIKNNLFFFLCVFLLIACNSNKEPKTIRANEDLCDNCKMQISDIKFACELITKKGKILLFDDIACLTNYIKKNEVEYQKIFFANYYMPNEFITLNKVYIYHSEQLSTPMSGNSIALTSLDSVQILNTQYDGKVIVWEDLLH